MTDNIKEDPLDNPIIPKSGDFKGEIIFPNDTDIITANQETENMELHKHPHHVTHKKKWGEYLLEFLMLFLAVFLGFLAENIREHKVEREREKEYVESMITDMKGDIVKIKPKIDSCSRQVFALDSLLQNIYHKPYTDSSLRMMYYLQKKYTGYHWNVAFTKRTITQLKNSGGLRLIKNKAASDSIIAYDENCENVESQDSYFVNVSLAKINDLSVKLFDYECLQNYTRNNIANILQTNLKTSLLNTDELLMKEYANNLYNAKGVLINYINKLNNIDKRASGIVEFLEKEYHLE